MSPVHEFHRRGHMVTEDKSIKVHQSVENLFRHEAGKIVSTLTRIFGLPNLELAEDAVQEALLKALRQWSFGNVPENPPAWLMRVAKNQALDILRRDARFRRKEGEIAATLTQQAILEDVPSFSPDEVNDDQLRMIFACCHPALPTESQVALTLKTICGFGVEEIARAFLLTEETIAKRLTRAKHRLRSAAVPFEIPAGAEISARLDSVLDVVYLLFNEGYNASHGVTLIRSDLCEEAVRLARLLTEHPAVDRPKIHALLALMLLQAARFPARIADDGAMLLLRDQDRTLWDKAMVAEGISHLNRSAEGNEVSEFHLQAGIAACHCTAESFQATDWRQICSLYDLLVEINDSPVIALNRAVAIAQVRGPEAALAMVAEIKGREAVGKYYLLYAVLGEFHLELGQYREAQENYRKALQLTNTPAEQSFLRERLRACQLIIDHF